MKTNIRNVISEKDYNEFIEESTNLPLKSDLQFFATQRDQTVHSGATVLIMVKNKVVGKIQGLDARRSFGTEPVHEVGSIMPQEHVHNRYEGSVTIDSFFVKRKSLKDLGIAALGEEVLDLNIFDVVVVDKHTKDIIRAYRGCTLSDYSENFRAGAISGENATLSYLKATDSTN